jgi:hypothetical protein
MFAQISENNIHLFDAKYGKDPELFKGIKYTDYRRVDFGHSFIYTENSLEGSLSYKGVVYENVILNYDVFEQVLLLTYKNNIGALVQLVLLTRYVDSFTIGNDTFIKNTYTELSVPFIRLFGDENGVQCIITYEKDYSFNNKASESGFGYSELIMKKYLLVDKKPIRLTRKKQLINYLPENKKELCKAYLKKVKMKFRQMNEIQLVSLCHYLNTNPNE